MGTSGPKQVYVVTWRIEGHTKIEASSPAEAAAKFEQLSAGDLIEPGYDDLVVGEPELERRDDA